MAQSKSKIYYPYFDWLRYGAAAVVVLGHSGFNMMGAHSGRLAVEAFFALSGFLIGGILLNTQNLSRFFYNRVARIWIPYFLSVFFLFAVAIYKDGVTERYLEFFFYDLTFTHNFFAHTPDMATAVTIMPMHGTNNHYWSIAVEEQFYLVAPLLIVIFGLGRRLDVWIGLSIFFSVLDWWYGSICAGVAAAVSLHRYGNWHLAYRPVFAAVAIVLYPLINTFGMLELSSVFSISAVLALATVGQPSQLGKLFGGCSYSLYLNHWIAIFAINLFFDQRSWVTFSLTLMLATILAFAHYLIIDRTIQMNRARFYTPARGRMAMTAGYTICFVGILLGSALWGLPPEVAVVGLGLSFLWMFARWPLRPT
jgi:peptidoglycan/LPS O-acetylase OafA/YrhL